MFKEFRRFVLLRIVYPCIYWIFSLKPLESNKVIFVEVAFETLSNNFTLLYQAFQEQKNYQIQVHYLRNGFCNKWTYLKNCISLIIDTATAKYVFLSDASNVFGCIPIREGSIFTQIWHGCGAFKKWGFSTANLKFGDSEKVLRRYPNYIYNTYMTVSSPEVVWAYAEATGLPKERIIPVGVSRTDILYDTEFRKCAKEHLLKFMPEAQDKKIILYAPTFRGKTNAATAPDQLSISQFFAGLSSEYVLIVKYHPLVRQRPEIERKYSGFARDLSEEIDIEELLCVSDICITDYSSLIFEYSLFERPMIFFAYDKDEYCDWRGFYYDYESLVPGPVFSETKEIIEYIKGIDNNFDKDRVREFKRIFMSACDGHAPERILQMVLGE